MSHPRKTKIRISWKQNTVNPLEVISGGAKAWYRDWGQTITNKQRVSFLLQHITTTSTFFYIIYMGFLWFMIYKYECYRNESLIYVVVFCSCLSRHIITIEYFVCLMLMWADLSHLKWHGRHICMGRHYLDPIGSVCLVISRVDALVCL